MVIIDSPQIEENEELDFVKSEKTELEASSLFSVLLLTHKPDQSTKLIRLEFD